MTGCGRNCWKTKKSEYLIDSKWLKVRKDHVLLPNGVELDDYFVIEKKDVALVVAMNDREEIILKKEYRYPMDEVLTERPGNRYWIYPRKSNICSSLWRKLSGCAWITR